MEPQSKPGLNGSTGFDGTQRSSNPSHGYNLRSSSSSFPKHMQVSTYILRAIAIVLTFISAIVMGTGKSTARVSVTNPITMQTTNFVENVKAGYSSSFVYFIVVNVLMFLYSSSSLALSLLNKWSSRHIELAFKISDILFLILLFSCNGAAISTSTIIHNGNEKLGMIKICDAVTTFCAHVTAAVVLSMFASIAHAGIILLGIVAMHNLD